MVKGPFGPLKTSREKSPQNCSDSLIFTSKLLEKKKQPIKRSISATRRRAVSLRHHALSHGSHGPKLRPAMAGHGGRTSEAIFCRDHMGWHDVTYDKMWCKLITWGFGDKEKPAPEVLAGGRIPPTCFRTSRYVTWYRPCWASDQADFNRMSEINLRALIHIWLYIQYIYIHI